MAEKLPVSVKKAKCRRLAYDVRRGYFNNVEEIVHFVNQAEKIRWDVDVCLGSCIVDGKIPFGGYELRYRQKNLR